MFNIVKIKYTKIFIKMYIYNICPFVYQSDTYNSYILLTFFKYFIFIIILIIFLQNAIKHM